MKKKNKKIEFYRKRTIVHFNKMPLNVFGLKRKSCVCDHLNALELSFFFSLVKPDFNSSHGLCNNVWHKWQKGRSKMANQKEKNLRSLRLPIWVLSHRKFNITGFRFVGWTKLIFRNQRDVRGNKTIPEK